jgi:protein tyrosine/serine phosphatase
MSVATNMRLSMLGKFANWVHQKERGLHQSYGNNITDPEERKRSWKHYLWLDHGILRFWWKNVAEIAPDVFRSNHPHHARFVGFKETGVKTVLNLRAPVKKSPYLFEVESCEQLDLNLVTVPMSARIFPTQEKLIELLDTFETIEKPFVMHCKSGADRTGLASVLYLLTYGNATDAELRKHLSFTYIHIRKTDTGRLDFLLETYLARRDETGIALRDWVETEYDIDVMNQCYDAKKANERFWQGWV